MNRGRASGPKSRPADRRRPPPLSEDGEEIGRLLRGRGSGLLMLDYDGTLAPFREDRDRAFPYPAVREALERVLERTATRVVVVSGRPAASLVPLLDLEPLPEIWGSHGWERRCPDGRIELWPLPEQAARGLAEADAWAAARGIDTDFEVKHGSRALHWRGRGGQAVRELAARARRDWGPLARGHGLKLRRFDGGLELRTPGRNKGDVVRTLLAESSPGIAAAYLGDDATDEDAFAALGTQGLSVLVRPVCRRSHAQRWTRPPGGVVRLLQSWTDQASD